MQEGSQKSFTQSPDGASKKRASTTPEARAQDALLTHVPPHSMEAEQAVLAGVFLDVKVMNIIVDMLEPEDFYMPAHQTIYNAVLDCFRKSLPVDLGVCAQYLKDQQKLEEVGGVIYLSEIAQATVMGANAEYYASVVRDKSLLRNLIGTCAGIIGKCYDSTQEINALLDASEQSVFSISQRTVGKDFSGTAELVNTVFENLSRLSKSKETITGVTTGFQRLDNMTAGLQPSDLIIVAARPSMGKTAFSMCMALNAAIQQNIPVAVYSLEMSKEQLMQRMLAVYAKVDVSLLRRPSYLTDEDWAQLCVAADTIKNAPIFIDDTPALSTMELRSRTRRLKAQHDVGLVIVDYLQLMRVNRRIDSRELEIPEISRSLKSLAKEMNVPVVAPSQLNRKAEERADKRPMLSDLRESGAIEQDADVIMFVYRDDVYKFTKPAERPAQGIAEIIIGKQRNGPVGVAELMYISRFTSFEDLSVDWSAQVEAAGS